MKTESEHSVTYQDVCKIKVQAKNNFILRISLSFHYHFMISRMYG